MFRGERTWMMIRVIFMVVFPRMNKLKLSQGLVGVQEADFAGRMTNDGKKHESAAARAFDFQAKPLVSLLVEEGILFGRAQNMSVQPVRALGGFILDDVKQRAIVGGPRDTG